jgi:hypothetical protein
LAWEEIWEQLGGQQKDHAWVLSTEFHEQIDGEEKQEDEQTALLASTAAAKKSKEMRKKDMTAEDKKGFKEADLAEWQSLIKTGAVRVLTGRKARRVRLLHAQRILRSRFVRVRKPDKYKSRWCILGFGDPDLTDVERETPHSEHQYCVTGTAGHCVPRL